MQESSSSSVRIVPPEYIRNLFSEGRYEEKLSKGELTAKLKRDSHPSPPKAFLPTCTRSQVLVYLGPAKPDATIHASWRRRALRCLRPRLVIAESCGAGGASSASSFQRRTNARCAAACSDDSGMRTRPHRRPPCGARSMDWPRSFAASRVICQASYSIWMACRRFTAVSTSSRARFRLVRHSPTATSQRGFARPVRRAPWGRRLGGIPSRSSSRAIACLPPAAESAVSPRPAASGRRRVCLRLKAQARPLICDSWSRRPAAVGRKRRSASRTTMASGACPSTRPDPLRVPHARRRRLLSVYRRVGKGQTSLGQV